ncbi:hypothetical protein PHET_06860 [Paragonimus heterotremus]|uniref:Transient receptor potential cation channel subfamily A member 1 n=1 Tax=Paragonimus heterotremus TaxID=100268 RepID=A0A8J4SND1_9TREM|nr:hypothetical protein PHET_06860 [Paragonimus heterotremus]
MPSASSYCFFRFPTSSLTDVNLANQAGNRPIHLAFKGCRISVVELLLNHGADYVCKNNDGVQPIHLAAEMNFVDGLKLDRGANMYHKNAFGDSPIHVAMFQSATKCARLLFEWEASRTCRDPLVTPTTTVGPRLLITPPALKSTGLLARLISREKRTSSCSSLSIISGTSDYNPELLINLADCEGFSPLHMAVSSGNLELVKVCLLQRADLMAKDLTGQIPLHFACARGDLDCVKLMAEFRPRLKPRMIRETNNDGRTPMHVAAMHNSVEVIDYLVSQGAEPNPSDHKRFTPLLLACSKGAIKSCIYLMELGADITTCDEFGRNILIMLLFSGAGKARELIPTLIKSGKFPLLLNQPDKWGCTYMHVAARLGLRVAINYGLDNQGSLLVRDSERSTPLHSAARFGRLNICAQMLEIDEGKRAQFLVDQSGRLPVHLAAQYGHNRVLELFQSKGCIQRRCRQGNTTLHYAAMSGNPATCALLLGINPSLLNETNHNGVSSSTLLFFVLASLVSLKSRRASKRFALLLMDKCVKAVCLENDTVSGTKFDFSMLQPPPHATRPESPLGLIKKWQYFADWGNCFLLAFYLLMEANVLINLFGPHGPHGVALSVVVMFISWFNFLLQLTQ